jgi:hypothetical protein
MKSSLLPSQTLRGLGGEQALHRKLETLMSNVKPKPEHAEHTRPNIECTASNLAETQLALQQVVELSSIETRGYINLSVRIVCGLGLDIGNVAFFTVQGRNFFHADHVRRTYNTMKEDQLVVLSGMSNAEVQRRTGFTVNLELLTYIFAVCNGSINTIKKRTSSLSWYEE